ncbi:C25 family cysteine peptidase [Dyadobacter sp. CY347]|uniref:putative type IX secretion system sortase PorU2 n=1 Tax=Dyadobacter sp. CY347 TaxID=2909336 RepID=UPI001F32B180|nr:C25 family cysteine peptidase [Dyadobacter sp. CY347]MCF2491181.1 C25 family cysteine peptidase [Dyadobacter sp. CY347]
MKTNFTWYTLRLWNVLQVFSLLFLFSISESNAQWSGFGNEWLAGKYQQEWVKIGVTAKGIHRIDVNNLPQAFKDANKDRLEMWHRGQKVSIIKADASEILFYGVPNDGASDEFLYRLPTTRKNPYYSTFSDQSAYFLTINPSTNGVRAVTPAVVANPGAVTLTSHIRTDLKKYANEYSHSTATFYRPSTFNSYFEEGKQGTGTSLMGDIYTTVQTSNPKSVIYQNSYVPVPFSFAIKNEAGANPKKVTIHIKSRLGSSVADIYVGKTAGTLRKVGSLNVNELEDYDYTFNLETGDFDANGGTLGFKSTSTGAEGSGFSISYFTVEYEQAINMQNLSSYEFVFPATTNGSQSKISITNAPALTKVYNISNPDVPQIISGSANALTIDRNDQKLTLFATSQTINVATDKISVPVFTELTPSSHDYLIICSNTLTTSANAYKEYRAETSPGRKFSPVVTRIQDIYDQFNYGEPSPLAIRKYVDYMISDGNKNKFLLLIGKSTTYFERAVREMPDEVPTVGFPGSDILLVDGLAGTPNDVPAIPVGRIAAISNDQVMGYLDKIIQYESQTDLSWRKNVIHMNGGKSVSEINAFANYLSGIASKINNAPFSGTTIQKLKPLANPGSVQQMSFATELNGTGVGMVSYFGHGSVDQTDYNAGYAMDNGKNYNNPENFPVLFYNGCGVNNIFSGRQGLFGTSPNNMVRPMSLDWLLAPKKGAIIVFGNTWDAFASNSNKYLARLYPLIFSVNDSKRGTIGEILKQAALATKLAEGYEYNADNNSRVMGDYDVDRANVHQILLQGDPALRILITDAALPVKLISFDAKAEFDRVKLNWKTASEQNNGYFIVERSYNAKNFEEIGRIEGKGTTETESNYDFADMKPLSGTSYYRLKQVDNATKVNGVEIPGVSTLSTIVSVVRESDNFLTISPNPAADFAEIVLDAPVKVKSYNMIDITGKVRKSGQSGTRISLAGLEAGEYIVEIVTFNGDVYRKKIVKK